MPYTYKAQFKIIVYENDKAVGSIRRHSSEEKYRFVFHEAHGGGKMEWFDTVDEVKTDLEKE